MTNVDEMSVKQMFQQLSFNIANVQTNVDKKIDSLVSTLATKDDLAVYNEELRNVKESNEELKTMITEIKQEREADRIKMEMWDHERRAKKLILTGLSGVDRANVRDKVNQFCKEVLKVEPAIEATRILVANGRAGAIISVEFSSLSDVINVLSKTSLLRGTNINIDRDLTEAERKNKAILLRLRRFISAKLINEADKAISIKVNGDRLKIGVHNFVLRHNQLWCGKESCINKLNNVFRTQFNNLMLNDLI